jgi:hypothetical protein
MNDNKTNAPQAEQAPKTTFKRPDESGSVYIEAHVKIFDPNTQDVLVEKRA